jgi:hypothetical protein
MRFYIISLILAVLFLLPYVQEFFGFSLGAFHTVLYIPYTGLDYMRIFFHELGHCVTFWLFGYPSVPMFDFEYGGGVTYPVMGRIWIVQGGVFAAMAAGLYYLCRPDGFFFNNERYPLLALMIALVILHLSLAFNQGHQVLIYFMGYGAEIIMAVFCMARAVLKLTLYGAFERYLNMIFGLFVIGSNLALLSGLLTSDIVRDAYSQQKGQELAGDFDQIAALLAVNVQSVAKGALVYMAVMLVFGIIAVWWWKGNEEVDAVESAL